MADRTMCMMNGDIVEDSAHRIVWVQGPQKCAQDLGETLNTALLPRKATGNELITLDKSGGVTSVTTGQVEIMIREAVDRLMQVQRLNGAPSDEMINKIVNLIVTSTGVGSFLFVLEVSLVNGDSVRKAYRVSSAHNLPANFEKFLSKNSVSDVTALLGT